VIPLANDEPGGVGERGWLRKESKDGRGLLVLGLDTPLISAVTGLRRGEVGPSLREKRPAWAVLGLVGEVTCVGGVESAFERGYSCFPDEMNRGATLWVGGRVGGDEPGSGDESLGPGGGEVDEATTLVAAKKRRTPFM